ncbi:hypothetical protein IFM89_009911 [Coptis chinensis]|uniref:Nop domain-containing protein n=1 Tax=Coptis chinensis TaxID=261450 RepID=A0A835LV16_9MAGN|nr:hypothetical protein IFM89_009911 [Coptis chinensis]
MDDFCLFDLEDNSDDLETTDVEANMVNYDLDNFSKLQKTQRYIDVMKKVEDANQSSDVSNDDHENDPELQKLIVDSTELCVNIENEIFIVHNFIRDKYSLKFPELESQVSHPIDYARVVKKIGNETDLTLVDLQGLLPSATIMVVTVAASSTSGKPLSKENLQTTLDACDQVLALEFAKKKILDFFESGMRYIAPSLSGIVGSAVAAKLIGAAGGLEALAMMDSSNIRVLGAKKKICAGACCTGGSYKEGSNRKTARIYRDKILEKIQKCQEPPPARTVKPLRIPVTEHEKKRGGARHRKRKQAYADTDMRKAVNRVQFGVPEKSSLGDGLGEGYGMLGQAGSGKLRLSTVSNKKFKKQLGATSGLTSCLAFTSVQGIELNNPQAHDNSNLFGSGTQSIYFSEVAGFSNISRAT